MSNILTEFIWIAQNCLMRRVRAEAPNRATDTESRPIPLALRFRHPAKVYQPFFGTHRRHIAFAWQENSGLRKKMRGWAQMRCALSREGVERWQLRAM
jgi:hypothetical protein